MRPLDIANTLNHQIAEFVQRPDTRRLIAGTGWCSTPFRGSLFGTSDSGDVGQALETCCPEALWLGSNPHVSESPALTCSHGNWSTAWWGGCTDRRQQRHTC
jgi:hypothetical protein